MEQFPSQYPDSPAVARFSGPQRARLGARRTRTSSLKPYARPQSSLLSASTSAAQSRGEAEEHAPKTATQNDKALPSTPVQARPERTGLLGSLGRALTRPLGWLASGAAKSDLHTSNSTGSLAPLRHGRSRLSVSGEGAGAGGVQDEGEAANAARRIGARLGASVMGSAGDAADDIESHAGNGGMQEPLPRSRTTVDGGWGAPPGHLPPPPSNRHFLATAPSEPALGASTSSFVSPIRRSGRGSHSLLDISGPSAFDAGRRQGSRLSVPSHEPTENERMLSRSPSPALSSASAMVRARGRESLPFGSTAGHGTAYAPSRLRGSSLHPEDVGGMSASQSSPAFAFGFGSERRFAGLGARSPTASPAPATSSAAVQYHLPSRSPLAVRGPRSSLGAGFGGSIAGSASMSDVGALPRPRGGGMYPSYSLAGGSRAGSVMGAWTSASALGRSAKRREWSSLNIAPDLGSQEREDVLMREYAALRPGPMPGSGVGRSGSRAGSVLGGLETMEAPSRQPAVRLGKRDADMSIDWDDRMSSVSQRSSKRQMVWDPDFGFISREELRAREPAPPVAQNEAERILIALESMRTPLGEARREGASRPNPLRHGIKVPVPVPASDRFDGPESGAGRKTAAGGRTGLSTSVAPYSRAARKSKLAHAALANQDGGMRAKLRRSRPAPTNGTDQELVAERDEDEAGEEEMEAAMDEGEEAQDDQTSEGEMQTEELQRPRTRGMTTRARVRKQGVQEPKERQPSRREKASTTAEPSQSKDVSRTDASSAADKGAQDTGKAPAVARLPPAPRKDKFAVRDAGGDGSAPVRSSLRRGAEKTTRSHQHSGRISAWEEDVEDEEDMPAPEELAKIKLPATVFPKDFKFGSGASTPASGATTPSQAGTDGATASGSQPAPTGLKALPAPGSDRPETPDAPQSSSAEAGENPLLGRLGGFAPPASSGAQQQGSTTPLKPPPSKPLFNFAPPSSSSSEVSKPAFSFGAPSGSQTGSALAALAPSKPSSNFFAQPPAPSSSSPSPSPSAESQEKKSGPMPNFFASSLAKLPAAPSNATDKSQAEKEAAPAPAPASAPFSFNKPASTFSFGKPSEPSKSAEPPQQQDSAPAPPQPNPFGGFGKPSAAAEESKASKNNDGEPPAKKPFSFAASAESPTPTPLFGQKPATSATADAGNPFGGDSASYNKKRGAEGDGNEDGKKLSPFGFKAPAQSGSTGNTSSGFSFGAGGAAPASKPFSFSKPQNDELQKSAPAPASATPAPTFSFGAPPAASASKTDEAPKPSTGLSFGASGAGANTATPASSSFSAPTSKPAFSFGTSATSQSDTSKPESALTPAPFGGFGASAANAPSTPNGAAAAGSNGAGNGGDMMEDSPSGPSAAASAGTGGGAAPPSTLTFGAGGSSANAAPSGTSGSGSLFGSPAPAPTSSASKPFVFGAPASSQPAASSSAPTFGSPAPASGGGLFGSATSATSSAPFSFGQSSAQQQQQPAQASGGPFGSSAGSAPGSGATSPFGQPAQSTGFSFGNATSSAPTSATTPSFSFGAQQPASSGPANGFGQVQSPATSTGFTFGAASSAANQPNSPAPTFAFGSGNTNNAPAPSGAGSPFTFSAPSPAPGATGMGGFGSAPGSPAPFVFGGGAAGNNASNPAMNGAGAAPAPFSFGAPNGAAPGQSGTPPGSAGGLPAPQAGALFNMGAPDPNATNSPGARKVRGLPQRRNTGRR